MDRPPADSPEEALSRYRDTRDPRDLGRLFDLVAPELFRVALHLCPDAASAEDALQEAFLAVMEHPDRYEPGRPARPWLASILRHHASKGRRAGGRVPDPARLPNSREPADPLLYAADAEERERVRVAILDLEEPYREAALLRWRYGLEPAEIAEVKGVPPGTVSSWLHRAVEKLRVEMGALPAVMAAAFPGRGLAAVKSQVLGGAAAKVLAGTAAATGVGIGAATLAAGGGIVAGKAVVGAAAAGVAVLIAWWAFSGRTPQAPVPAQPPVEAPKTPPAEQPAPVPPPVTPTKPHPKEEPVPPPAVPGTAIFDPASATATLRIRATARGTLPKLRPVKFDADPKCGEQHKQEVLEQTVVATDGKLANVIAWVSKGAERWTYPVPAGTPLIDQKGCMYEPHVLTVRVGQPITIRNSDPCMHNIHAVPKANSEFNRSQLKGAADLVERFEREEVGVKIKCDVHGWMGAWAGVFAHPFHGVTDGEGMVEIRVPPGEYEVSAWHEYAKFGKQEPRTVTVAAGETREIEFDFGVR